MNIARSKPLIALLLTATMAANLDAAKPQVDGTSNAGPARTSPNIIVLFADDLGYRELSCQGNPEIPTPHIDSNAANGVRFENMFVTRSTC